MSCICGEQCRFCLFGCSLARGLLCSLLPWLHQLLQWLCMDLGRKHRQLSSSKCSGYSKYRLFLKIWQKRFEINWEFLLALLNPFSTFICSQLQIKNTCRHGFSYSILPLTHSTFLKGSLTWAAFCLASSSCLWLSKASCSALIFQRAKSRSWRCCCAYRSGKRVLTMQVKYKDLICFSHWLLLPLKDLDLLCWGYLFCWNRIFNSLTLFLFKATHILHTLPPQFRKEFRRSINSTN